LQMCLCWSVSAGPFFFLSRSSPNSKHFCFTCSQFRTDFLPCDQYWCPFFPRPPHPTRSVRVPGIRLFRKKPNPSFFPSHFASYATSAKRTNQENVSLEQFPFLQMRMLEPSQPPPPKAEGLFKEPPSYRFFNWFFLTVNRALPPPWSYYRNDFSTVEGFFFYLGFDFFVCKRQFFLLVPFCGEFR